MGSLDDLAWPRTTERLVVRRARREDAEQLWPWQLDPDTTRWLTHVFPDAEAYARHWRRGLATSVVAELDGRIVATGKVAPEQAWGQAEVASQTAGTQAELGWVVAPDQQGRGIGTEFARELLAIAFATGVRRVTAYCFADNVGSARVMQKIGMRQEAHFRADSLHRSGAWLDSLAYAALASDAAPLHA